MKTENFQTRILHSVIFAGLNRSNRTPVNVNILAQCQWHHIIKPGALNSDCQLKSERMENFFSIAVVGLKATQPGIEYGFGGRNGTERSLDLAKYM
jgi:hypothetical protein